MTTINSDLQLLKAIIKAELTKAEMSVLAHVMSQAVTTVTKTNSEMSCEIKMAQPNFVRSITSLKSKNVIGDRKNGIFIKAISQWGK